PMTTTTERAEINLRNARYSTGPRSPQGKERSRLNAIKHGMSARTPVLPGEDAEAFRRRVEDWTADPAPRNAVERFLVERAAMDSWKIERADRVEAPAWPHSSGRSPASWPGASRPRPPRWAVRCWATEARSRRRPPRGRISI